MNGELPFLLSKPEPFNNFISIDVLVLDHLLQLTD